MRLIAERGYKATTLRAIAKEAGVSVGLLYRYFPNKQAVVIALYDELSADYARRADTMPSGKWRDRFLFACVRYTRVPRTLWHVLAIAGVAGFATAVGVHSVIGYVSFTHLGPAVLACVVFAAGLVLSRAPPRPPPRSANQRTSARWRRRLRCGA